MSHDDENRSDAALELETSEYSIEDIIREFSSEAPVQQEATAAAAPAAVEDRPGPEPEVMRQSEIASAIAQAVADAFEPAPEPVKKESEVPPEPVRPETPEPEPAPEAPVSTNPPEAPKPPEKKTKKTSAAPEKANSREKRRDTPPEPSREPVKNPGTQNVRIPKSKVSVGPLEYIGTLISDIHRRQMAGLPAPGASLRKREKRLSAITQVDRILSYARGVILLLMVLCLAGRKYAWMSLGFMAGMGGAYTALVLTVLCFFLCWQTTLRAFREPVYLRFSFETLLLLTTVLSMVETVMNQNKETLLPLLTMAWCLSGISDSLRSQAELRSLRGVITGRNRKGVRVSQKQWEKQDCVGKAPASVAGFVRHQGVGDVFHSGFGAFGLLFFLFCLITSAYLSGKTKGNLLTILVTLLTVGMPVGSLLCCSRPYHFLARVLAGRAAVAGWYGMKGLKGKKAVLIYDNDLFPRGAASHKGVRVCGSMDPRLLTSYGASMIFRGNMGLDAVFTELLREMNGEVLQVSHFMSQESGMEGYIHNNLVQVGSYQYMQLMGISLPKRSPRYGIYLAVNQKLEGVFAIHYQVARGAPAGFRRLVREPRLTILLAVRNFCVTPAFVEHWFGAPISALSCPKAEVRRELSEPSLMRHGMTCGFVFQEGAAVYSRLIAGARRVYRMGFVFTILSIVLSCVLTIRTIMALSAGTALLSGPRLLLFQLILVLLVEISARIAIRK